MKQLLLNCYWDGMTLANTVEYIARCFGETPTERQISAAKKAVKDSTGKDWL